MNSEDIITVVHGEYTKDYYHIAEVMVFEVVNFLCSIGGIREDDGYVAFHVEGMEDVPDGFHMDRLGVYVSADFLDYYDGGKWVKKMWANVKVHVPDIVSRESMAKFVKSQIIDNMPICNFRDENAYMGNFRCVPGMHSDWHISFFVNPAYPDGVWHNNTL